MKKINNLEQKCAKNAPKFLSKNLNIKKERVGLVRNGLAEASIVLTAGLVRSGLDEASIVATPGSVRNGLTVSLIILSLAFFTPLTLHAQSLSECISYAKEHSLRMKQAGLQVERAKRNEGTYFEMDKTELSLSQDPTAGGSPDNALTLSQSIDFPTVYSTRKKVLRAETQVSESQRRLSESELVRDVSSEYANLLLFHQQVQLLQRNDSVLDSFVHIAQTRLANGEANRLELMNATQQKADNLLLLHQAQSNEQAASLTLQQLMNVELPVSVVCASEQPGSVICDASHIRELPAVAISFQLSPQSQLLESEKQLKERELRYAKQGYMPSFSLGWRHQLLLSGINPYGIERTRFEKGNWMGFEFGIAFPLFYGSQKAKTAVAKYDLELATMKQQEQSNKLASEYNIAKQNVITAQSAYNNYQRDLLPQAKEMRRLSQVEYEAGEISYVEHIQNLTSALSIELKSVEAANALNQAIITLSYLIGK